MTRVKLLTGDLSEINSCGNISTLYVSRNKRFIVVRTLQNWRGIQRVNIAM